MIRVNLPVAGLALCCGIATAFCQPAENVPLEGAVLDYRQGLPSFYFAFDVPAQLCRPAGGYLALSKSGWKLFGFPRISTYAEGDSNVLDHYVNIIEDGDCVIRLRVSKALRIDGSWHTVPINPGEHKDLTDLQKRWLPGGPAGAFSHLFNFFSSYEADCPTGEGVFNGGGGALILGFSSESFNGVVHKEMGDAFVSRYKVGTPSCAYDLSAEMFRSADGVWQPVPTRDPDPAAVK